MSTLLVVLATTVVDPHKGVVLPEGRIVVIAVPLLALCFYLFVVRRKRER